MEVYKYMDKKDLYQLIYDFLAIRIKIGCYKYGDQILIKPLAEFFHISTITIRKAFSLLEQNGYINLAKNQKAIVIYQYDNHKQDIQIARLSSDISNDIDVSYRFFLSEIIWRSLPLCLEKGQANILEYLQEYNSVSNSFSVLFLKNIIETFGNPLLIELHIDIFLYTYPTTIQRIQEKNNPFETYPMMHHQIHTLLDLYEKGNYEETYSFIQHLYDYHRELEKTITSDLEFTNTMFRWNTSQIRYQIASDFIVRCHTEQYKQGSLTPSMKNLAKQYQVSYMTMRRTFSLLNKLGVVETINGIGTRILTLEDGRKKIQWDNEEIQKHMLSFLYAMQILAITAYKVSKEILSKLSDDEFHEMTHDLQYTLEHNLSSIALGIWLKRIIDVCELRTLVEIYKHLASLLVWGYPLRYIEKVHHYPIIIRDLIHALQNKDEETFARCMETYCFIIFTHAKKTMLSLGITEATQVKTPDIHHVNKYELPL